MINNAPMVRLGELITECDERNSDNALTLDVLKGISTSKVFIETKANQMSLLSCSRFSSACKPCVWIYSTDQRKIPVCLRQMAGLQCLCQCS